MRMGVYTPTRNVGAKRGYLDTARQCLEAQSEQSWDWYILVDSAEDEEAALSYDLPARVIYAEPEDRNTSHPLPWLLNKGFRESDNEFLFLYADDDLLNPEVFKVFVDFFDSNPDKSACVVSLCHQWVSAADQVNNPQQRWLKSGGVRCSGSLDCRIDGGQVCVRKSLLDSVSYPWWPESAAPQDVRHMDGLYLENVARTEPFHPVGNPDTAYVTHRFTPVSTFSPHHG